MKLKLGLIAATLLAVSNTGLAEEKVLNLYSARHYQTDEALYNNFTQQTGIKINRIEGKEDELLERIKNEGANSPADVFITVDATRLAVADSGSGIEPRLLGRALLGHVAGHQQQLGLALGFDVGVQRDDAHVPHPLLGRVAVDPFAAGALATRGAVFVVVPSKIALRFAQRDPTRTS